MLKPIRLLAMAMAVSGWLFCLPALASESPPVTLDSLDKSMAELVEKENLPSLSYAIVQPDKPAHIKTIGSLQKGQETPVTADTAYRIASISKMFVGIAAMQLIEEGKIDPDSKVAEVLPEFKFENPWEATHPLKVKHLLESTTGFDEMSLAEFVYDNQPVMPLTEALRFQPDSHISRWAPGTRHSYSNTAAAVTALLIEKVTEQPFTDYVQTEIFTPLGMNHTFYGTAPESVTMAEGHSRGNTVEHDHLLMYPAGGASSSISDMQRLLTFFTKRGEPLLNAESIKRMEQSQTTNAGKFDAGYGIYNFARYYDGWGYRGHDGSLPGWTSELSYSPDKGTGFALLLNDENPGAFYKAARLLADFIAQENTVPTVKAEPVPQRWQEMSGYYRLINPRIEKQYFIERIASPVLMDINDEGAHLSMVANPGWQRDIIYVGNDMWSNDKGEIVMTSATDPVAGDVIHYGDRVFVKTSAFGAIADKVIFLAWFLTLVITVVYTPVWLVNKARGKIVGAHSLQLRKWMSLSALVAVAFLVLIGVGLSNPFDNLGGPGTISVALFIASILLAIVTVWACWKRIKYRGPSTSRWLRGFVAVYLVLQLVVVIYLAYFGVIGLVSWT